VACGLPHPSEREAATRLSAIPLPQTVAEDWANPQPSTAPICAVSQYRADSADIPDTLPKNRTGKLHRRALRESLAAAETPRAAGRVPAAGDARACSASGPAFARSEYRYQSAVA
jgi:hypothetical protein